MFVRNIWSSCVLCQHWSGANWGSLSAWARTEYNGRRIAPCPGPRSSLAPTQNKFLRHLFILSVDQMDAKELKRYWSSTRQRVVVRHWIYSALVIMWQGRGRITRIANLRHIYCSLSTQANRPPCQIMDYISREWAKETHLIDLQLCTVDDGTLARLKERRWPPRPGSGELVASNRQLRALPCRVQWCLVARHFSTWLLGSWGNSQGQRSQAPRKSQRWTWWVASSSQIPCKWS